MIDMTQHPMFARQLQLEEEMRSLGVERFQEQIAKAKESHQESRTTTVRRILGSAHTAMAEGIEAFMADAKSGKAGRKHSALRFFELIGDVDLMAHMTLRAVMDSVSQRERLPRASTNVATLLEDEVHFRQFKAANPKGYKAQHRRAEKSSHARYRRNTMLMPARKMGVELDEWTAKDKLLVGMKLIEILVERTGLAKITRCSEGSANTPIYVEATPETLAWIESENTRTEWMMPVYMPTIIPPKPWTSPFDGGYWSGRVRRLTLVKSRNKQYLQELAERDMPLVYDAVNALQETPWAVNQKVLAVMENLWANQPTHATISDEDEEETKIIPTANKLVMPTRPLWLTDTMTKEEMTEEQQLEFTLWKQDCARSHERNAKSEGRRMGFTRMMAVARRFKDEGEFFFPHTLDWRGRIYPASLYLTPQGNDAQRGLLEFAEACPINDEQGALWLAVHGAGCWGVDKVSLEERKAWIEANEQDILASAADPLANRFWTTAEKGKKAWQALAFCFEWAGFKEHGYAYESCLPVQMDGTCNGLQNFSALLRDEIGGRAVNLVPADKPQDIYTTVAEVVARKVEHDAAMHEDAGIRAIALGWVGNVTRKVTKRPVMTLAYGARKFGFKEQVFQDTVSPWKSESPSEFPFEGSGWAAAAYMGDLIWDAVGEVVVAATACMDWLQEAARVAAKEGLPVLWATPVGFLVHQAYTLPNHKRIETTFEEVRIRLSIEAEGESKIDSRRQASGVSPNWIHSLDASHMMRTIARTRIMGLRSFSMIHDSYGTHAGNAQVLADVLREEFVAQYQDNVLAQFRDDLLSQLPAGAELPELPAMGTLDLDLVLESPFFFA